MRAGKGLVAGRPFAQTECGAIPLDGYLDSPGPLGLPPIVSVTAVELYHSARSIQDRRNES